MYYQVYRNQRSCRIQPLSAELMLWITGHVGLEQHGTKSGWSVHIWTPTLAEVGLGGPHDPHRIAVTVVVYVRERKVYI